MRVATVDGLVTLFYDGSKELYNEELDDEWWEESDYHDWNHDNWESWDLSNKCKRYIKERLSWQQIIIEEGVTEIPEHTFQYCHNVKRVIFPNTVIRIENEAFYGCKSLVFCKLSINLEFIGEYAFWGCKSLTSMFIPPSCRKICDAAFGYNKNLSILHVPRHVELGNDIIQHTALVKHATFEVRANGWYITAVNDDMNTWIKNINHDEAFSLHRACASFQPLKQDLINIVEEKGLNAFREVNSIGITPSQYLKENPYTALTEKEIIHEYLMKLMGESE